MRTSEGRSRLTAAVMSSFMLAACGGGSGDQGGQQAGAGGTVAFGTVTGFGSVIVDGVRIDDSKAMAGAEYLDGSVRRVELKIGHSIELEHDGLQRASHVRSLPELKGPVTALDKAAGTLTVAGVKVGINADPAAGPVTVFDPPYSLANASVGDPVEIHGILKADAQGKPMIQATRIERKALGDFQMLRGRVGALSTASTTFRLGDLTVNYRNAMIIPATATLFDGAQVIVHTPASADFNGTLQATAIKVKDYGRIGGGRDVQLRGVVSNFSRSARTFELDGITVDASGAEFDHSGRSLADLSDGMYVRVRGGFASGGILKARKVSIRSFETSGPGEVELHGSILNFVAPASFTVRGVAVDARGARIDCGSALGNTVQVEVKGSLTASGAVVARRVECKSVEDGSSVISRDGMASNVDTGRKTFLLSASTQVPVQWTDNTLFVGVSPETLSGRKVDVDGPVAGGVLQATKVGLHD